MIGIKPNIIGEWIRINNRLSPKEMADKCKCISLLRKQLNLLITKFKESGRVLMGLNKNDEELKKKRISINEDSDEEREDRELTGN